MSVAVHFFPVRHHSPTAARWVRHWIRALRPSFVLIEGPSDFDDQLAELDRPHVLPIAIYTYVLDAEGARRGAFYPFCVYSPEWQALVTGFELGARVQFIDLPWGEMVDDEAEVRHRYGDHELTRSGYVERLCAELGVESFDDAWDRLVEIDGAGSLETYLERAGTLCEHLRAFDRVPEQDLRREAFMLGRIREARASLPADGAPILVVTGGYHTPALRAGLDDPSAETRDPAPIESGSGRGLALTPYSYPALDKLSGYDAGLPSPGFYHQVWEDREAGRDDTHRRVLFEVARVLRRKRQPISAADLVAAEVGTRALARLRGHATPWRTDVLDGAQGALVKEELAYGLGHPLVDACLRVMRGDARGRLAEGTAAPALVRELRARLEAAELWPEPRPRRIELDLAAPDERAKSQLLHSARLLGLVGFERRPGRPEEEGVLESWQLVWRPELESSLVEAATWGTTVGEAVTARLLERVAEAERDAELATRLLDDALSAGVERVAGRLARTLSTLIAADPELARVARAAEALLALRRFDTLAAASASRDVGDRLVEAFWRGAALLDGQSGGGEPEVAAIVALQTVFERERAALALDGEAWRAVLERAAVSPRAGPAVRGAAAGAAWSLGHRPTEALLSDLAAASEPETLGDFLSGVLATARAVVERRPEVAATVDRFVTGLDPHAFLVALPGLRLAFARLPPRERSRLARSLIGDRGLGASARLEVPIEAARRMLGLEARLAEQRARLGVRDPEGRPPPTKGARS